MFKTAGILMLVAVGLHYSIQYAAKKEFIVHEKGGILVTGASSGIGRDAAVGLAKKGYIVFAGVRKQSDADDILKEGIATLKPVIVDVTKQETVDSCYDTIVKELGSTPLISVVNNAGIAKTYAVELFNIDDAKWNFEVNYFGLVRITQKFLPLLRKTGKGARIVQISSIAGKIGGAGGQPYSSTKWAVESLSETLRKELHPFGISVSCINPGFIQTKILNPYKEQRDNAKAEDVALYPHVLGRDVIEAEEAMMKTAPTTAITTKAIVHAVMDPFPQLHYVVGEVDGTPIWVLTFLSWALPGRLFDALLRNQYKK